jgi:perosamine synthetase
MSYFHEFLNGLHPLSGYLGSEAHGGKYCSQLELAWEEKFGTKYAVAVNSATSGLLACCMAIALRPGDEVIVSPYTMSATAAAPAVLGAKIVFCDIEKNSLTLNPEEVVELIGPRTKAVIVTNLFGAPAHLHELKRICDDRGVFLIEDNAQAILAAENEWTGTIGHMGVFSLNVHKHIQTGEGGVIVTNDQALDQFLRGAINHGEMRGLPCGLNLRMTEIAAAMALDQLEIVETEVAKARRYAELIKQKLNGRVHFLQEEYGCQHSYYCLPFLSDSRDYFLNLGAKSYVQPLYHLTAFAKFKRICPVAEWAYNHVLIFELCHNPQMESILKSLGIKNDPPGTLG